MASARPRVLVVHKKSAYQIYVRERRHPQVASLLRRKSPAVAGLMRAHRAHMETLRLARKALRDLGAQAVFRQRNEPGQINGYDLVVTIGGDGTLLWASQMVPADRPVVAINSAPKDSVGYFCAGCSDDLHDILAAALAGRLPATRLTRMQIDIDGVPVYGRVLNDVLFSHPIPAGTTRYAIRHAGVQEEQRSSGVWISTAAGSTAAIRSAGGRVLPIGSKRLQFMVREPYEHHGVGYRVLRGMIAPGEQLEIQSHMRSGRLYIDGPRIFRPVDIGSVLRMYASDQPLTLLGFRARGRG
jgi:NAD+ kinase